MEIATAIAATGFNKNSLTLLPTWFKVAELMSALRPISRTMNTTAGTGVFTSTLIPTRGGQRIGNSS
jgi:hypothetical protein